MNSRNIAPVAIYTYTRIDHLHKVIDSLKKNKLSSETILYIVSDGASCEQDFDKVSNIRNFIDEIIGFREVVKIYRPKNFGPLESITRAEEQIVNDHGKIISLEDDNLCSSNFLNYMNQGLDFFEASDKVFSICGYVPSYIDSKEEDSFDFWMYPWNISWGYAMTKKKYNLIHPLVNNYPLYKSSGLLHKQNKAGGLYVTDSLRRDYQKKKRLTDAILCTEMFKRGIFSVLPVRSKVFNLGQDGTGQSTSFENKKYDSIIDCSGKLNFDFNKESKFSEYYKNKMINFQNGSEITKVLRKIGIYHEFEQVNNFFKNLIN